MVYCPFAKDLRDSQRTPDFLYNVIGALLWRRVGPQRRMHSTPRRWFPFEICILIHLLDELAVVVVVVVADEHAHDVVLGAEGVLVPVDGRHLQLAQPLAQTHEPQQVVLPHPVPMYNKSLQVNALPTEQYKGVHVICIRVSLPHRLQESVIGIAGGVRRVSPYQLA